MTRVPLSTTLAVIGSAIGMAGGFAPLFTGCFGIFVKPISMELGWTRSQVSLLLTMGFLGYALGAPVLGMLNDRFGARRVLAAGIVVFSAALAGLGLLPKQLSWLASLCLLIGISGAATAPSGYVLILAKLFERRLGLAIGLAMLGLGIGLATAPMVAQFFITTWGWRGAYRALALLGLVFGVIALVAGVGSVAKTPRHPSAFAAPTATGGATFGEALRSWRFWLIGLSALVISTGGFGASAHLAAALSDKGVDLGITARIAGTAGTGVFIGRIGAAILMDRIFAPFVALSCSLLGGAGLLILIAVPANQPLLLFVGALLMGFLAGSEGDTMPFLTRRYFGVASFGSIYGCIIGMAALGGIIGPLGFGYAFDLTGHYDSVFQVAAVFCAASGLVLPFLGAYRYPVDRRARPGLSPEIATVSQPQL